MDEVEEDVQIKPEITIRRPFQPKFMRELNQMQQEKNKKQKRKQREQKSMNPKKREKFERIGIPITFKSNKKLPQTNRNGNKIFGTWKNNQLQGQAQIYYNNGVIFKGIYQNGVKVKGHFQFLHGYEYIGYCLGNKFDGQGSLIFPSGKIITGEWKDYNLLQKGKIQYPNGEVYYGEIRNLKKHGKGYLFFQDNSKFQGEFQNGQIMGFGTYYVNDEAVSTGNWIDGQLEDTIDLSKIQSKQDTSGVKKSVDKRQKEAKKKQLSNFTFKKSSRKNIERVSNDSLNGKIQKKLRFADTTTQTFVEMQKNIPDIEHS